MPLLKVLDIRFPETNRFRIEYKSDNPALISWIGLDSYDNETDARLAFDQYRKDELFKDYIIRLLDLGSDDERNV